VDVHRPDELAAGDRDDRPVERPALRACLEIDGRLGGDPVALLGDRSEEDGERQPVVLARWADLERGVAPARILSGSAFPSGRCRHA
jgi:hypothetical protein